MIKRVFQAVFVTVVLAIAVALLLRGYSQMQWRSSAEITSPDGIESLEEIVVNGDRQWIYIRGHNRNNPVMLYLHGGPGMSEMPLARAFGGTLEQHVTIVHWDQRGSGKSRAGRARPDELSVQTYLDDVLALTHQLRARFNQDKIYLVGHSWGSLLGVLTVRDHPDLYHAYVGVGQIASMVDNETVSLAFVKEQAALANNTEALEALRGINITDYAKDLAPMQVQRRWLYTYGGGIRLAAMPDMVQAYMTSPEYSLVDLVRLLQGSQALPQRLWGEVMGMDLTRQATTFELPVYFFAGEMDYNTPSELAAAYLEALEAPHKALIWFEGAAHFPNFSDPDAYQRAMLEKVLVWH